MLKKLFVVVGLTASLVAGCSGNPPTPGTSGTPGSATAVNAASPGPAAIDKAPLPSNVQELEGTALGSVAADVQQSLTKPPETSGAYFVLVAPKDPTKGVLVWGGADSKPEALSKQAMNQIKVSGQVKSFEDPSLAQLIQTKHGITLAAEGSKIQYIVPSQPLWPGGATPVPAVTATPSSTDTRTPGAL